MTFKSVNHKNEYRKPSLPNRVVTVKEIRHPSAVSSSQCMTKRKPKHDQGNNIDVPLSSCKNNYT